ncbi:hypothetical protein [Streptosporangium minutum]|uniref:Uncharacterized protein n=1 Tax=Streptosporangium minutum TaxID=569862 RepID=A0A243RVW1_9ACTN|nr:hypothetical protein [Streptosporangium minutum]OUC99326.1 hypothetical protein CA984_03715 [Streptosporangium minutum]
MAEAYGRWADDPRPAEVNAPAGYSSAPQGPVRRAELHQGGVLLGHVWTDDRQAAGFLPAEQAGPAGVRAAGAVWTILQACYEAGMEAEDLIDPDLFEGFELRV